MTLQKHTAIQTALDGNWETAIGLNEEILKQNPSDTETLNRLAFALTIVGRIKDAKEVYQRVLRIDVFNPIALKNLRRLGSNASQKSQTNYHLGDTMFLEEHGKTKVVTLTNTAQPKLLKVLQIGQPLQLSIKRSKIFALNDKQFVGMLPEDIGKRLIKLMKGGNMYEACIKGVEKHIITIFIKETKRVARFKNQPSFTYNEKNQLSLTNNYKQKHQDTEVSEDEA